MAAGGFRMPGAGSSFHPRPLFRGGMAGAPPPLLTSLDAPLPRADNLRSMPASKKAKAKPAARNSVAVEDYLERILELINTKGYARVVDIAESLKISQASVTNMVQRLDGEGLLKYEKYRGLALTASGEALALNITRRHRILTDFLRLFGLDEDTIFHDVEGMEHHISPPTLKAIEALTAQLTRHPALVAKVRGECEG